MQGLPKIALARLKGKPEAPKTSGPSGDLPDFQGAEHPDANLLAAFAEKTLTEQERAQVLNHLSQCADCREVAAFIVPADAVVAEPTRGAAARHWNAWLVIRWGAMAAVLGTLTLIVVLHPGMWKGQPEVAKLTPPPVPAAKAPSAPPTASLPAVTQPSPITAQSMARAEANKSAGGLTAAKKESDLQQELALESKSTRTKANRQGTMMAASRPPAEFRAQKGLSIRIEQGDSREVNTPTPGAAPEPAPPSAPAGEPLSVSGEAGEVHFESKANVPSLQAKTSPRPAAEGKVGAGTVGTAPAKPAPRATAQANLHTMGGMGIGALRASHSDREIGAAPPPILWNVSSDGNVQRSTGAGKAWEQVPVADGVKFRAIAALGNDVWTGGMGGALFHSLDAGATWVRVDIIFGGKPVTETITGLQTSDSQHLTVTTASGAQWVSEDGGRNWQKKP